MEGTKWLSSETDYFDFSTTSVLNYYESFSGEPLCFEHNIINYLIEGDSLFLTATEFDVHAGFRISGDTLYLYAFDGVMPLNRVEFNADTLPICLAKN